MENEGKSALFNLRIAKSLIDDVAEQTEDVVQLQKLALEEDRFLASLKKSLRATREVLRLKKDLSRAIDLAKKAREMEPNVHLDDGTPPEVLIAQAYFQGGLTEFSLGHWDEAQRYFEDSYKVVPTQEAAFNIALCLYRMVYGKSKQARYIRGLNGQKIYYSPLFRKKKARAEVKAAFERVIAMNPNSDLAVEAGKFIIRLK